MNSQDLNQEFLALKDSAYRYAASLLHDRVEGAAELLDKLLAAGQLNAAQYLRLLPTPSISDRDAILKEIEMKGVTTNE